MECSRLCLNKPVDFDSYSSFRTTDLVQSQSLSFLKGTSGIECGDGVRGEEGRRRCRKGRGKAECGPRDEKQSGHIFSFWYWHQYEYFYLFHIVRLHIWLYWKNHFSTFYNLKTTVSDSTSLRTGKKVRVLQRSSAWPSSVHTASHRDKGMCHQVPGPSRLCSAVAELPAQMCPSLFHRPVMLASCPGPSSQGWTLPPVCTIGPRCCAL